MDGWHRCQSSLRSEEAAVASLTLYVDEFATYHQVDICCKFRLYVDSTSAISNVKLLRDLIPKRRFPNNADLLSTMSSAHYVLQRFHLTHVPSHQDKSTDFADLHLRVQKLSTIVNIRFFSHAYVKKFRIPDSRSGFLKFSSGLFWYFRILTCALSPYL